MNVEWNYLSISKLERWKKISNEKVSIKVLLYGQTDTRRMFLIFKHKHTHTPCNLFYGLVTGWFKAWCWEWYIIHVHLFWFPNARVTDLYAIYVSVHANVIWHFHTFQIIFNTSVFFTTGSPLARLGNYATAWTDSWRVTQQILYDLRNKFLTSSPRNSIIACFDTGRSLHM